MQRYLILLLFRCLYLGMNTYNVDSSQVCNLPIVSTVRDTVEVAFREPP